MLYSKFPNIGVQLQQDLKEKMFNNIESEDFKYQLCNCQTGTSHMDGNCRKSMVVHWLNQFYISNMQQKIKTCFQEHCTAFCSSACGKEHSKNTFVHHMAEHFLAEGIPYSPLK
jgi:hypothetical protein